jgi:hypothetical protein
VGLVACYDQHGPGDADGATMVRLDASDRERDGASSSDAGPAPFIVRDTSGWSVAFDCRDWDGPCNPPIEIPDDFPVDCGPDRRQLVRFAANRLFRLYATCGDDGSGWYAPPNFERAVTCAADADCARLPSSSRDEPVTYTCTRGLCQNLAHEVTPSDVIVLCLDTAPRTESWAAFLDGDPAVGRAYRLADTTCPSAAASCSVPMECRAL